MDRNLNNVLVLAGFAAVLIAGVLAYLLAWRSKRETMRTAGSLATAVIMGAAGLFFFMWLMLIAPSIFSHDVSSVWGPLIFSLVFLLASIGAFYLSASFLIRALRGRRHQAGK
jgi:hypothetical protein